MKTSVPKIADLKDKKWFVVDAEGKILGRLAVKIADILRGKHKPQFTPHMDLGDHVIVLNAGKFKVTGRKLEGKSYYSHTQYPGHLTITPLQKMLKEKPLKAFEEAIKGMLPKNKLRDGFLKKLHLCEGTEHRHGGQNAVSLDL